MRRRVGDVWRVTSRRRSARSYTTLRDSSFPDLARHIHHNKTRIPHVNQSWSPKYAKSEGKWKSLRRDRYNRQMTSDSNDPREGNLFNISHHRTTPSAAYRYRSDPPPPFIDEKLLPNVKLPPLLSKRGLQSRCLLLNRPGTLNAIDQKTIAMMNPILHKWDEYQKQAMYILVSTSSKDFTSGLDFGDVYEKRKAGDSQHYKEFFAEAYQLMYNINNLQSPYIPVMQGLTLGGAAGIALNSPNFRATTETTVLGFPEVFMGWFPDCGASSFLNKLPQGLGLYLALTGRKLKGVDLIHAGAASHFLAQGSVDDIMEYTAMHDLAGPPMEIAQTVLWTFGAQHEMYEYTLETKNYLKTIYRLFGSGGGDHLEFIKGLEVEAQYDYFARDMLAKIRRASPWSIAVTLRLMKEAQGKSLKECLEMEYRVGHRLMLTGDFLEGYEATVIEKRQPVWDRTILEQITTEEVDKFFERLPEADEIYLQHNIPNIPEGAKSWDLPNPKTHLFTGDGSFQDIQAEINVSPGELLGFSRRTAKFRMDGQAHDLLERYAYSDVDPRQKSALTSEKRLQERRNFARRMLSDEIINQTNLLEKATSMDDEEAKKFYYNIKRKIDLSRALDNPLIGEVKTLFKNLEAQNATVDKRVSALRNMFVELSARKTQLEEEMLLTMAEVEDDEQFSSGVDERETEYTNKSETKDYAGYAKSFWRAEEVVGEYGALDATLMSVKSDLVGEMNVTTSSEGFDTESFYDLMEGEE